MENLRTCSKCKRALPFSEFSVAAPNKGRKDGYESQCKECRRKAAKRWKENNKEAVREYKRKCNRELHYKIASYNTYFKRLYNMTFDEAVQYATDKGLTCMVCGKPLQLWLTGDKRDCVHLDHCHDTGVVRGILCSKCNSALGLFNDDINLVRNALEYLKE